MEGVTGTMAWLGCVPGKRRGGLESVVPLPFFRIPYLAEMEAACRCVEARLSMAALVAEYLRYVPHTILYAVR